MRSSIWGEKTIETAATHRFCQIGRGIFTRPVEEYEETRPNNRGPTDVWRHEDHGARLMMRRVLESVMIGAREGEQLWAQLMVAPS